MMKKPPRDLSKRTKEFKMGRLRGLLSKADALIAIMVTIAKNIKNRP
jgi:hypothetical protein